MYQFVLDGSGQWMLHMAAEYTNAQITGIDLVKFDVKHPFKNLNTISPVDITTDDWPVLGESQDLVHCALLCGSVPKIGRAHV